MRKPLLRRPVRRQTRPLLPPTTLTNCGERCLAVTLYYEDQPVSFVLHNVGSKTKIGIALLVGALSV